MTIQQLKTQALDIKIQLDKIQKIIEDRLSSNPHLTKEGFDEELNVLLKEYDTLFNVYMMFLNELRK